MALSKKLLNRSLLQNRLPLTEPKTGHPLTERPFGRGTEAVLSKQDDEERKGFGNEQNQD